MKCIYFKEILPCTSQEHIIPASLGGINKLPIGYVSDRANSMFSPIEQAALRRSILAVNRENVGPGKRGSLNVSRVKSPQMRVLQDCDKDGDHYKIGFVFCGQTYMIPQLIMDFKDNENSCEFNFTSSMFASDANEHFAEFKANLVYFLCNFGRSFSMLEMPFNTDKHFILIGQHNKKWYAATSHRIINMDALAFLYTDDIRKISINYTGQFAASISQRYIYKFEMALEEADFVYARTAFNTCAYFLGKDVMLMDCFDSARNSIKEGRISENCIRPYNIFDSYAEIINSIPEKSHYIIIESTSDGVIGYVGFYSEKYAGKVELSCAPVGEPFTKMLICDWKNRNEYTVCIS